MTTKNTAAPKTQRRTAKITECTIIAIYKFKTNLQLNGTRCTLLRNGGGKEYKVWTHSNGCASHCDCDGFEKSHGRRKCYHIKHVEALEAAKRVAVIPEPVEEATKPMITDEQMAAIAAAAHEALDETPVAAEPVKETRVALLGGYHYEPQYRDGDGAWQSFKGEEGEVIWFCDEMNKDLAHKFIAVDSDEHRAAVLAEYKQRIEEHEARETARAAQRQAESERRMAAPINGSRAIGVARVATPVLAALRVVPTR